MSYATLTTDDARMAAIYDIESDLLETAFTCEGIVVGSYVREVIAPSLQLPPPVRRDREDDLFPEQSKEERYRLPSTINSLSIVFPDIPQVSKFVRDMGPRFTLLQNENDTTQPFTRMIYTYTGPESGVTLTVKCVLSRGYNFPVDDFLEHALVYRRPGCLVTNDLLPKRKIEGFDRWAEITMHIGERHYQRAVVSYDKVLPNGKSLYHKLSWKGVDTTSVSLVKHIQQGYLTMLEGYALKISGQTPEIDHVRRLERLNEQYLVYLPLPLTSMEWPRNPRWEGLFARMKAQSFIADNRMAAEWMAGVDPTQLDWKTLGLPH